MLVQGLRIFDTINKSSLEPDNWESFADGIGDDGGEEEVRGKQVDKAEHKHLQLHIKKTKTKTKWSRSTKQNTSTCNWMSTETKTNTKTI